jgi:hypothetical protein
MWYTSAFNKIIGIGGGILPPLPRTNEQVATQPEADQQIAQIIQESKTPPPPERTTLEMKLRPFHTEGNFAPPMSQNIGRNTPSAILDQHPSGPGGLDNPNRYEDYRIQNPGAGVSV